MKNQLLQKTSLLIIFILTLSSISCKKNGSNDAYDDEKKEENKTASLSGIWDNKTPIDANNAFLTTLQFGDTGFGTEVVLKEDSIGRVDVSDKAFSYTITNNNTINIVFDDKTTAKFTFSFNATGNILTLTSSSGEKKQFTRIEDK